MRRLFSLTHTVRYDECNNAGSLTPAAFVRYMQDIAARDAEDALLVDEGYWVVRRTSMAFATPVAIHAALELRTYGIGFTRITAQRGYEAFGMNADGSEPLISARTLWVYMDAQGRPRRLPEQTAQIWLPDGPLSPQAELPFPAPPASEPASVSVSVRFSDIDIASHLNNASAVELLDNAAWEGYAVAGIVPETTIYDPLTYDLEYLDSPRFGEKLEIQSWLEPLPGSDGSVSRYQQIMREGRVVVRAVSRWSRRSSS